jgi:hypothetical protein
MIVLELTELSIGYGTVCSECSSSTGTHRMIIPELAGLITRNGTVCSECSSGMGNLLMTIPELAELSTGNGTAIGMGSIQSHDMVKCLFGYWTVSIPEHACLSTGTSEKPLLGLRPSSQTKDFVL